MNIFVYRTPKCKTLSEFLDFNQLAYKSVDLWDQGLDEFGRLTLSPDMHNVSGCLLVMDVGTLLSIFNWKTSRDQLINFCKQNKIWVWDEIDSMVNCIRHYKVLTELNDLIKQDSITVFLDGELSSSHKLNSFNNIKFKIVPYNFFLHAPRIHNAKCNKKNCSKDFMLTTVKKITAPHREILFRQLQNINGLLDCGHVRYGAYSSQRIGHQSHQHTWNDGHPSMDLYNDSWLEIAPETLYRDGFFITEKTVKPIVTGTPFLTVGTCKFLEYLKQFGFRTFHGIIDERYDQEPLIEDRVKLMLGQLQDIIKNGSESFYHSCGDVLKHNQDRLLEIAGRKTHDMDIFLLNNLEQAGFK